MYIGPWYFGLIDDSTAFSFQKKAWDLQINNHLYEWAYRYSKVGGPREDELAHEIMSNDIAAVEYLKSKGFPGNYILNHLKMSSEGFCNSNN